MLAIIIFSAVKVTYLHFIHPIYALPKIVVGTKQVLVHLGLNEEVDSSALAGNMSLEPDARSCNKQREQCDNRGNPLR